MKSRALLGRSSDPLFLFGGQRDEPIGVAPFVGHLESEIAFFNEEAIGF
jgi:hypothetical protein